jgi:hypothetical protein
MDPRTKSIASACLFVVAILVVAGYTITSAWTGFRGNTVCDRLGLVVLPVTLLIIFDAWRCQAPRALVDAVERDRP